MTHAFDMNQHYVQLATPSQTASTVQVTGPANIQTAPPGHYMLFVLNESRVPSVARFVRRAVSASGWRSRSAARRSKFQPLKRRKS